MLPFPLVLIDRLNKTESAVFVYSRFSLFLNDPFFPDYSKTIFGLFESDGFTVLYYYLSDILIGPKRLHLVIEVQKTNPGCSLSASHSPDKSLDHSPDLNE